MIAQSDHLRINMITYGLKFITHELADREPPSLPPTPWSCDTVPLALRPTVLSQYMINSRSLALLSDSVLDVAR